MHHTPLDEEKKIANKSADIMFPNQTWHNPLAQIMHKGLVFDLVFHERQCWLIVFKAAAAFISSHSLASRFLSDKYAGVGTSVNAATGNVIRRWNIAR